MSVTKEILLSQKATLEDELERIEARLARISLLEKPYEAIVTGYSGRFSTFFKSESPARRKFEEYNGKQYFRNGLVHGVMLIRHNEDGSQTHLECRSKARNWKCSCEVELPE